MNLRIAVTYPATDGSMPESVEVEWLEFAPADHPAGADIVDVLDRLLTAPSRRGVSRTAEEEEWSAALKAHAETTKSIFGGSSAGTYTAGRMIHAGSAVALGPDGYTLYPAGSDEVLHYAPAGVAAERLETGDVLGYDRPESENRVWSKLRRTT